MSEASGFYELDAGPVVRPSYGPADIENGVEDVSPGEFPFTRGITVDGVRAQPTLIKIYAGLGSPHQTNVRLRKLADWGVELVQLAADLPSQIGYDPDHIMSAGEVGRAGVSIASLRDMEIMFDDLRLDRFRRVGMLGNSIGPIALALFACLAEKQGVPRDSFVVDLQNDPLKEYVARGTQFLPIPAAVRLAADVVEWSAREAPHWYPLDVCVNHLNAAGAGSTAGTALALANAECYIEELRGRGLVIDEFAPLLQMFLDEREDFFAAVANIRATRRIWAHLMRDQFGAVDPRTMALQVIAYGHGRETRQEPLNNIARIALASLAYYFAGIQSLYTASYDEVVQTPSDDAVRVAVRTQQILRSEFGFSLTTDPLGGSYYVEALTDEIERRILQQLTRVREQGGAIACIESGYIREILAEGAVRRQLRFETGERPMVGVDRYPADGDQSWAVRPVDGMTDEAEERRRADVAELRRSREQRLLAHALRDLETAVRRGENSVPSVIAAVRAYATVGEISDIFRSEFGEWTPDQAF